MPLPKNIYIADDDFDDVEFFKIALKELSADCTLTVANDGDELVQNLQKSTIPPNIIFLDVNMPKIDGLSVLSVIRQMPYFHSVPVVVYSTSSLDIYVSKAYEKGASLFVVKPYSITTLKELVAYVLSMDWQNHIVPRQLEKFVMKR